MRRWRRVTVTTLLLLAAASDGWAQQQPAGHTVPSDGHPLRVWEKQGDEPRRAILLVHGRTWSSLPDFDLRTDSENLSFMDALAARDFDVYAVDLRGYGGTPRDSTGWNTPVKAARDVTRVLEWVRERNQETPVFLFGWSLGSMVAHLVTQQHPELIDGVILYGYPVDPERRGSIESKSDTPLRRENTADDARSDFITPGAISREAMDAYVDAALAADPVKVDWKDVSEFGRLSPSGVTVPLLLVHGESDPLVSWKVHSKLFTDITSVDRWWVVIAGGDHAVILEHARGKLVKAVADFVNMVEAR